jgi:hypothetical protein
LKKKLWLASWTGFFILAGCSSMKSSIEVDAPAGRVWDVLSDLGSFKDWNPFLVQAGGRLAKGQNLELQMKPVGGSPQRFSPKVLEVTEGREITWQGTLFLPGLFDGTHHLRIEPLDDHRVLFTQTEDFAGIFVPFVDFNPYRKGWEKMDEALKIRCEEKNSIGLTP